MISESSLEQEALDCLVEYFEHEGRDSFVPAVGLVSDGAEHFVRGSAGGFDDHSAVD